MIGINRRAARAAVVGAVLLSSLCATSPAMALNRDDGDDPGPGMSKLEILGIFVGIPVATTALIWLLVSIPSMVRGPRYRPGKEWQANSEWYGGPGDEVEGGKGAPALESGRTGGDHDTALTGKLVEPGEGDGGGTSARW